MLGDRFSSSTSCSRVATQPELLLSLEVGVSRMSVKNGMRPVHPGEILREELNELGLSANAMAKALGVPANRVTTILKGQRGVTADTALRLSLFFGTTPHVWLNLKKPHELRLAEDESGTNIVKSMKHWAAAPPGRNSEAATGNRVEGRPQQKK